MMNYKYKVELSTSRDIKKFTESVESIKGEIRLTGKDENGSDWNLSAKSLLCTLIILGHNTNVIDHEGHEHTAGEVDWNSLWVESDEDIYSIIKEFVVTGDTISIHH